MLFIFLKNSIAMSNGSIFFNHLSVAQNFTKIQGFLNFSWVSDPFKNLIKAMDSLPKICLCNILIHTYINTEGLFIYSTDFIQHLLYSRTVGYSS